MKTSSRILADSSCWSHIDIKYNIKKKQESKKGPFGIVREWGLIRKEAFDGVL